MTSDAATPYLLCALPLAWLLAVAFMAWGHRHQLRAVWREPVLRWPVLVLESDDWGAGPLDQARALRDIAEVLSKHRDAHGKPAVLNLALVLSVPDGAAIAAGRGYHYVPLDAPLLAPVLQALKEGVAREVFRLQLHGGEHFWPAALVASTDPAVRRWLRQSAPAATELLPPHLQSRWVNAAQLPSVPLAAESIRAAVSDETRAYERIVGEKPAAVVPPTFVWTETVERAWAAEGVEYIVTPGWRSTCRNTLGVPDGDEGPIVNGDRAGSLTYLARTDYFEPARGRDAEHALRALSRDVAKGRPCILENHRGNFIFGDEQLRRSLAELDALCAGALRQHPDLRFLSTVELGVILRDQDSGWLVTRRYERLAPVWQRLRNSGRLWRLMRLTGVAALGQMSIIILGGRPSGPWDAGRS